jgi:transposase
MDYKLIIGIDQSKLTIDAALLRVDLHEQILTNQFENTVKGFKQLMQWIDSVQSFQGSELLICAENTGLYSYPLCVFCKENSLSLWLESPLQIKHSMGIQRGKNDRIDAIRIAQYAYTHRHRVRLYDLPTRTLLELRQLMAYRERLIEGKKSFSTPASELKEFSADLSNMIGKGSNSIVALIEKNIVKINEKMLDLIREDQLLDKQFKLILSVPGIGQITAMYLLIYSGGFSRFEHWRKFACFCGIAPFDYQSGTSIRGKSRVHHLANKKMKSVLTLCALSMIRKDNEYKQYYDRKKAEGKHTMSILNVIRNKIISRAFAVIKKGVPYVPYIEFNNAA